MDTASIHEGVRRMRFSSLLDRQERGEITQEEAAEMLGVHVRTFQRWATRYEDEGEAGLADRRVGRRSPRRAPQQELERMLGLYRDKYADFTVKHFHEQLVKRHGYKLGYTVTKLNLHAAGLVKPARRRSAHRKKRQRRPLPGMMLHQDGSRHVWIEGRPPMDLIVTLDEAASGRRGRTRPRSVVPWRSSASSTSPPTRPRPGAARSAPSAPCRIACLRSCGSSASRMSRPPTVGCASTISANTTRPLRSRRSRRGVPSCRIAPKPGARFSVSSRSARSATTTPSPGPGDDCSCRKAACARTSSRPASTCTNTLTTA